jgi:2-acylglycerol O-acyltransferase 2
VERKSVTLNATFLTPFYREWILANGFISADKSTLVKTLQTKSLILVPGGAVEALYCQPGTMKLYLKNRKGFIRLAMETNKPLIPCIGFGENEIFDTVAPTKVCSNCTGGFFPSLQFGWIRFQRWFMSQTGVSLPLVIRPIPRATKIRVVVGSPLLLDSSLSVDENHRIYVENLTKLYHRHAGTLGYGNVVLDIE